MQRIGSIFVTFFVTLALLLGVVNTASAACVNGSPDGVWEPDQGEQCDDGNNIDGDGCDNDCTLTQGYECSLDIDFDQLAVTEYNSSDAAWTIGTFEAEQTANTVAPTFAYFGANAKAKTYNIGMRVEQNTYNGENATGDDDFIGFVLGFDPANYKTDTETEYLLIDWKARDQRTASGPNGRVDALQGLRLSHVTGQPTLGNSGSNNFWVKSDQRPDNTAVRHLEWASGFHENESTTPGAPTNPANPTYGNTGWDNDGQVYIFTIDYSNDHLLVKVHKDKSGNVQETVLDVAAADFLDENNDPIFPQGFPSGEIAFYGLSQAKVVYSLGHDLAGGDRTSVCEGICGDGLQVGGEECDGQANCNQNSCHWNVSVTSDDFATYSGTPEIIGEGSVNGDITVVIKDEHDTVVDTVQATVDSSGNWSVTPSADLPPGDYTFEVEQQDIKLEKTNGSGSFSVVPLTLDDPLNNAVFGGPSFANNDYKVPVSGTGIPGTTVTISVDRMSPGVTTQVDASGNWSADVEIAADGTHTIQANSVDEIGMDAEEQEISVQINLNVSAVDDNLYLYVDGDRKFDPLANDSNYDASTFELTVLPEHGTITGPVGGYYTYTVNEGFVGNDTAVYKICNTLGDCDTAVIHIYIYDFTVAIDTPAHGSSHTTEVSVISGTGEIGEEVIVHIENGETKTGTVDSNGNWSVTLDTPLKNDTFKATATIEGYYGTVAAESEFTVHINACEEGTFTCGANMGCQDSGSGGNYTCVCLPGFVMVGADCVEAPQVDIQSPGDGEVVTTGTPDIFGTANPNSPVEVFVDGVSIGTTTSNGDGEWTLTPDDWTEQPAVPIEDGDYEVAATVTTDVGNATDISNITINTDVCGEELNSCEAHSTCEDHGNGDFECVCDVGYVNDDQGICALAPYVSINTPSNGSVIRTTTPTLTGNANPESTVEISIDGVVVGTVTSDEDGNWTFTVPADSELDDGDGDYEFTAKTSVGDDEAEDTTTLTLDSTPHVIIDTPVENAEVSDTPTVKGTAAPNAEITIVIRGDELGTTTADENGQWTWTATDALDHGPADIVAIDKDNDEQDDVNVLIGDIAPVKILTPEDGSSSTDKTPTVTGTGEPNTDVTIIVDGEPVATVPVDENGDWTWTPDEDLTPGEHTIVAEGVGGSEDEITITVTRIPTVITTPEDGASTTDDTPTVTGTGEPNTDVTIIVDGEPVGTVPVDENGDWTWTPDDALTPGDHPIKAVGENGTEDEITVTVTEVDSETPTAITGPADGSTTDDTPTVTGTGEPNTDVTITVDGEPVATVPVDENGDWTWTPDTPLEDGNVTIKARGEDGSTDSITITVDTDADGNGDTDPELGPDPDVAITGGRMFGCASASQDLPVGGIVLFSIGAAILVRRRRKHAA